MKHHKSILGLLACSALLYTSEPIHAEFTAGSGSARAGYTYTAGIGGIVDSGATASDGNLGAGGGNYEFADKTEESAFGIKVKIDAQNQRFLEFEGTESALPFSLTLGFEGGDNQALVHIDCYGGDVWVVDSTSRRTRLKLPFLGQMRADTINWLHLMNRIPSMFSKAVALGASEIVA